MIRYTHTVPSRTNISFLGSFITLSQRYFTRKATFEGAPDSSLLGIEREYFFWFAKSNSNPPLKAVRHGHADNPSDDIPELDVY
jgi:hypothetical protein